MVIVLNILQPTEAATYYCIVRVHNNNKNNNNKYNKYNVKCQK